MAGKFLTLDEAAQKLGMSGEELNEARAAGKIHGYRDGASWKFKTQEIDRFAAEADSVAGDSGPLSLDEDIFADDQDELISLSAEGSDVSDEPESESESGSNTAIGRDRVGGSDIDIAAGESDLSLDLEAISDLKLEPTSDLDVGGAGDGPEVDTDSDVLSEAGKTEEGGTGDLDLTEDSAARSEALDFGGGSDLELGGDDDELVLEGSGVGSDLSLGSSDTGINIASPSESGLSLEEEPLELEGSSASALELPEDDEMITLESEIADPDEATQLKPDEDFQLSPSAELGMDESDSGSQVIALEDSDSESFDDNATLQPTEEVLLAQDPDALVAAGEPLDMAGTVGAAPRYQMAAVGPAELPETPYSIWNVLTLLAISLTLLLSGLLMVDVVRNMWSWDGNFDATTSLMDGVIDALGMRN